jgi:hypothetical protein
MPATPANRRHHFFGRKNSILMNEKFLLLTDLAVVISLILGCVAAGHAIRSKHHWKASSLFEIAAEIGYMAFWGVLLSHFFSFNGSNPVYSVASNLLFLTFLLPFLALTWFADWPAEANRRWADRNRCNPWPGFLAFGASMTLLGIGAYFACLNSTEALYAPYWGFGIGFFAFAALLLLAARSEKFLASA